MNEETKRRMTKQRRLILEVLRSTKTHPTADWIYDRVREDLPNISLGTVYRNLKVLQELGEINELNYGSSYSRFDGVPMDHYHFCCEECGGVYDVEMDIHPSINDEVEDVTGFIVNQHRCEFYGLCLDCQEE